MITITDWNETFENAGSRKLKRLEFCNLPLNINSSGYLELVTEHGADGLKAFGVFISLVQLTASFPFERRGRFVKSSGEEMTEKQIAALLRISEKDLSDALQLLKNPAVGWVSATDPPPISHQSATNLPVKSNRLPPTVQENNSTHTVQNNTSVQVPAIAWNAAEGFSGISDRDFEEWEEAYPACDLKRQLAAMNQWLKANPAKARKSMWRKFITNWLKSSQEKGGDINSGYVPKLRNHEKPAAKIPAWANHPRFKEAASEVLEKPFDGTWEDFPKIRVTELKAELEGATV